MIPKDEFELRLCDKCLAMYERDRSVLLLEFCLKCRTKIAEMIFETQNPL